MAARARGGLPLEDYRVRCTGQLVIDLQVTDLERHFLVFLSRLVAYSQIAERSVTQLSGLTINDRKTQSVNHQFLLNHLNFRFLASLL